MITLFSSQVCDLNGAILWSFDRFYTTGLFLYPVNASENQEFSVFSGYIKRTVT